MNPKTVQAFVDNRGGLHRSDVERARSDLWHACEQVKTAVRDDPSSRRLYPADVEAVLKAAGSGLLRKYVNALDDLANAEREARR